MDEFTDAARSLCALRFACPECRDFFQQAFERGVEFENRVEFIGTTLDRFIPGPEEPNKLLVFVTFEKALFTAAPEYYAPVNSLAPTQPSSTRISTRMPSVSSKTPWMRYYSGRRNYWLKDNAWRSRLRKLTTAMCAARILGVILGPVCFGEAIPLY